MEGIILPPLVGVKKNQIDILPHALERETIQKNWIYDVILNKEPSGVLKQREDRYRIYYEHPTKNKYDFIVVIDIKNSPKIIKVVTTYEQSNKRRVR